MKKLILSVAVLALSACGSEDAAVEDSAPVVEEEAAVERPAMEGVDLVGDWQLVTLSQDPVPATVRMTIGVDADTIRVRSGCANMSWPYTLNGNIIETGEGSGDKSGCAGDYTTWEYNIAKTMRHANIVMITPEGQVQVTGPGGMITLARVEG